MSEPITLDQGHFPRIEVTGWIAQRVGTEHPELTAALRHWGRCEQLVFLHRMDWISRAQLWCAAREYPLEDGGAVYHDTPWLSRPMAVVRAWAGEYGAVAIVSIDAHAPRVYADVTTDGDSWYQVDILDIVCPQGHRWTWHGGEVLDQEGGRHTVAEVFGGHPYTPFSPCPDCLAYDTGRAEAPCGCAGSDIIVCPHCGGCCDLRLTPVPNRPQRRAFAVHVSDLVTYQGWVMATDSDDADEQARALLSDGATATGCGRLDVVHGDREVTAGEATQVCWRCRTDPRQPHPTCPHPIAHLAGAPATVPAVAVDSAAVTAWLAAPHTAHPHRSNAAVLHIGPTFGHGTPDFLSTIEELVHARPDGLVLRGDIDQVALWLIPDGDIPDRGAVLTVDLANGLRLASTYQDAGAFAAREVRGVVAATCALAHLAAQVTQLMTIYQSRHPQYQPPNH